MKVLDKGQDKINQICQVLRKETLEPAQEDAHRIINEAKEKSKKILLKTNSDAKKIIEEANEKVEREKAVFQNNLDQACKQTLDLLKQEIEKSLFDSELNKQIDDATKDTKIIADLISVLLQSIESEGIDGDLKVYIGNRISVKEVSEKLVSSVISKLKEPIALGDFKGGVKVQIQNNQITLDISDIVLKELFGSLLRQDFREILFRTP